MPIVINNFWHFLSKGNLLFFVLVWKRNDNINYLKIYLFISESINTWFYRLHLSISFIWNSILKYFSRHCVNSRFVTHTKYFLQSTSIRSHVKIRANSSSRCIKHYKHTSVRSSVHHPDNLKISIKCVEYLHWEV